MTKQKHMLLCPKCHKVPVARVNKFCAVCKSISLEAEKQRRKIREQNRPPRKYKSRAKPPRKCQTESCQTIVYGKSRFCNDCNKARKSCREQNKPIDSIGKSKTGLEWMQPIIQVNAEARGRGVSYGKECAPVVAVRHTV